MAAEVAGMNAPYYTDDTAPVVWPLICTCGPQPTLQVADVPDTFDPYCPTHGCPDQKCVPGDDW